MMYDMLGKYIDSLEKNIHKNFPNLIFFCLLNILSLYKQLYSYVQRWNIYGIQYLDNQEENKRNNNI